MSCYSVQKALTEDAVCQDHTLQFEVHLRDQFFEDFIPNCNNFLRFCLENVFLKYVFVIICRTLHAFRYKHFI